MTTVEDIIRVMGEIKTDNTEVRVEVVDEILNGKRPDVRSRWQVDKWYRYYVRTDGRVLLGTFEIPVDEYIDFERYSNFIKFMDCPK